MTAIEIVIVGGAVAWFAIVLAIVVLSLFAPFGALIYGAVARGRW